MRKRFGAFEKQAPAGPVVHVLGFAFPFPSSSPPSPLVDELDCLFFMNIVDTTLQRGEHSTTCSRPSLKNVKLVNKQITYSVSIGTVVWALFEAGSERFNTGTLPVYTKLKKGMSNNLHS